jgi:hypothetical protein
MGEKAVIDASTLSVPTAWRWKDPSYKKVPSCVTVLNLLKAHSGLDNLSLIASNYDSVTAKYLADSFPAAFVESKTRNIDKNIEILEDDYDFQIYFICCNERGATTEEITYTLGKTAAKNAKISDEHISEQLILSMGEFAKAKIQRLVNLSVLSCVNRFFKCLDNSTYIQEDRGLQKSLNLLKKSINPKTWQSGKNVFYLTAEAVEDDIAAKVTKVLGKAFMQAAQILEDNKTNSSSAKPYMISVAGDYLVAEKNSDLEEPLQ